MQTLLKSNGQKVSAILILSLTACLLFALLSLFVTSNYFATSAIKILLFTAFPLFYFLFLEKGCLSPIFSNVKKRHLRISFILGGIVIVLIVVGFLFLQNFLDRDTILAKILANNITAQTYPIVFIYIVVINAFIEEFFFRGFVFLNLKRLTGTRISHIVAALMFSLYHITIVIGAVELPMLILMLAGLFAAGVLFNEAARRSNNIWCSLIIHISANIALNSIIAYYFYFT